MKTSTKGFLFCLCVTMCSLVISPNKLQAQVEFKINPVKLLNQKPTIATEFLIHDRIGIEASWTFLTGETIEYDYENLVTNVMERSGNEVQLAGKYYFKPPTKGDGLYGSLFGKSNLAYFQGISPFFEGNPDYRETSWEVGTTLGYKKVFWDHLVIDVNAGRSAVFGHEIDYMDFNIDDESNGLDWNWVASVTVGFRLGKKAVAEELPLVELEH